MELTTPERRERPSRAAAPKSFKDPESDSDEPNVPRFRSVSSARSRSIHVKDETVHSSSDPAVETSPLPTLNQSAVLKKRSSSDEEADSPNKKVRKIVLKTNKSATASNNVATPRPVTPDLSHVEDSPSNNLSDIQSLHEDLTSIHKRISTTLRKIDDAVELDAAKKKIDSHERQLLEASSPDDSTSKLKQCQKELAAAVKRNSKLLNDNVELTRNLKDTQAYANGRQAYADELRREIAVMCDERDPNFNDAFKVTDDEIELAWNGIRYDIFSFVAQVLTVKPFRKTPPRGADHSAVEALKKEQKKDANLAEFYFEQYIWKCLVLHIFQGEAAIFGGPAGRVFQLFCLDISKIDCESMPELSRVKAHTANLLYKQFDENNQKEAKGIVDRMKNDLAIFMGSDQEHKAEERLKNIVSKAVWLNSQFLKSRAFFVTDWGIDDEGDNFDNLNVCHRSGIQGGKPVVGIHISPRLSKIGNADGEFFNSINAMVICKPIVTLSFE